MRGEARRAQRRVREQPDLVLHVLDKCARDAPCTRRCVAAQVLARWPRERQRRRAVEERDAHLGGARVAHVQRGRRLGKGAEVAPGVSEGARARRSPVEFRPRSCGQGDAARRASAVGDDLAGDGALHRRAAARRHKGQHVDERQRPRVVAAPHVVARRVHDARKGAERSAAAAAPSPRRPMPCAMPPPRGSSRTRPGAATTGAGGELRRRRWRRGGRRGRRRRRRVGGEQRGAVGLRVALEHERASPARRGSRGRSRRAGVRVEPAAGDGGVDDGGGGGEGVGRVDRRAHARKAARPPPPPLSVTGSSHVGDKAATAPPRTTAKHESGAPST